MTDHFVYRAYDIEDRLLYVGVTYDPRGRMAAHRQSSPWWHLAARIDRRGPLSPDEAYTTERAAIQAERPLFNVSPGLTSAPPQRRHVGTETLRIRVSKAGVDAVDHYRYGWSRSEYVRQALSDAVKAGKRGPEQVDL